MTPPGAAARRSGVKRIWRRAGAFCEAADAIAADVMYGAVAAMDGPSYPLVRNLDVRAGRLLPLLRRQATRSTAPRAVDSGFLNYVKRERRRRGRSCRGNSPSFCSWE